MSQEFDSESHHRRSIRLATFDYGQVGAYFVTVCAYDHGCLFGDGIDGTVQLNELGRVVEETWASLPARYPQIELDSFVIMPNHIHGIVVIMETPPPSVGAIHELPLPQASPTDKSDIKKRRQMLLPKVIGYFKMNSAKRINQLRQSPGVPVWQRNYYEHVIRNEADCRRIQDLIAINPAQWDLDKENPSVGAIHELSLPKPPPDLR